MTITTDLTSKVLSARRVSTPLIKIDTADPAATVEGLVNALGASTPCFQWDIIRGLQALNNAALPTLKKMIPADTDPAAVTGLPTDMLRLLDKAPRESVIFMLNAPMYWDAMKAPDVIQAIWNLRDPFKASKRTLIMLGTDGKVPQALEHDVTVFVEPLPGRAELEAILQAVYEAVGQPAPTGLALNRCIDAMSGLSAFAAEQVCAMSMTKAGVDLAALRERRRRAVENTPGLTIYRGTETFEDLGGLRQLISFFRRVIRDAREPIKAIAFIDELDKAMAGTGTAGGPGDSSGVSQDALKVLLTNMQDNNSQGAMFFGVPGAGKTAFVKALANEMGVELIMWDLGAMQASLVGQSQANVRMAAKVTEAVGQGAVLYLATCNGQRTIPTELRRRFRTFGEWFFDLPAADETPAITNIYLNKYGLTVTPENPLPDMTEWTGAEIKSLCYLAYDLQMTFTEAAQFVVPMAVSAPDVVDNLRKQAEGKFLSVSDSGYYNRAQNTAAKPKRQITLDDVVTAAVTGAAMGTEFKGMKES